MVSFFHEFFWNESSDDDSEEQSSNTRQVPHIQITPDGLGTAVQILGDNGNPPDNIKSDVEFMYGSEVHEPEAYLLFYEDYNDLEDALDMLWEAEVTVYAFDRDGDGYCP